MKSNDLKTFRHALEEFKKTLIPVAETILLLVLLAKVVNADISRDSPVGEKQRQQQKVESDERNSDAQPRSLDLRKERPIYRLI